MAGRKKEIVYPFFLECCVFTSDSFWETIFEDLAYGKAPFGTYISKDFLCCSSKGKEFSYKLERKDPRILYEDVYKLLTEKLSILSRQEKAQKQLLFNDLEKSIKTSRKDWTGIRCKNVKDIMYEKYVIDMKHKYNLSTKQCKFLLATILISIIFKTITSKDIEFNNDRIQNIAGIEFKPGKIILQRPLCSPENLGDLDDEDSTQTPVKTELEEKNQFLSEHWDRFCSFHFSS
jgi:hypothetical protein